MSLAQRDTLAVAARRRGTPLTLLWAWVPVLIWAGFIFSLSGDRFSDEHTAAWLSGVVDALGIPPAVIAAINLIVRKCAHFVEYAILGMLIVRALRASWPSRRLQRLVAFAVLLTAGCAAADELNQHFATAQREGTWRDAALDTAGGAAGVALAVAYLGRVGRRRRA